MFRALPTGVNGAALFWLLFKQWCPTATLTIHSNQGKVVDL